MSIRVLLNEEKDEDGGDAEEGRRVKYNLLFFYLIKSLLNLKHSKVHISVTASFDEAKHVRLNVLSCTDEDI